MYQRWALAFVAAVVILASGCVSAPAPFYENGQPRYQGATDIAGERTGRWTFYTESGLKRAEGNFIDGEMTGTWRFYHLSGQQAREMSLLAGMLHGPYRKWLADGVLVQEGQFSGGERDGLWKFYDAQGELRVEIGFNAGEPHGTVNTYYADLSSEEPAPESSYFYNEGKLNGEHVTYFREGQKMTESTWEMGKLVDLKAWEELGRQTAHDEAEETMDMVRKKDKELLKKIEKLTEVDPEALFWED